MNKKVAGFFITVMFATLFSATGVRYESLEPDVEIVEAAMAPYREHKEKIIKMLVKACDATEKGDATPKRLYITYGPPGSGKGRVMRNIVQLESMIQEPAERRKKITDEDEITTYLKDEIRPVNIIMDDMLEKIPDFNEVKEQLRKSGGRDASQAFYWALRKEIVNELGDALLPGALRKNRNVILEITGRVIDPEWFGKFLDQIRHNGYKMVVAYPLAQIGILHRRAQLRQQRTGQEAAPLDRIRESSVEASRYLNSIGFKENIDMVVLYDNEGEAPVLLFAYQREGKKYAHCGKLKAWLAKPSEFVRVDGYSPRVNAALNEIVQIEQAEVEANLRQFVLPAACQGDVYDYAALPEDIKCTSRPPMCRSKQGTKLKFAGA